MKYVASCKQFFDHFYTVATHIFRFCVALCKVFHVYQKHSRHFCFLQHRKYLFLAFSSFINFYSPKQFWMETAGNALVMLVLVLVAQWLAHLTMDLGMAGRKHDFCPNCSLVSAFLACRSLKAGANKETLFRKQKCDQDAYAKNVFGKFQKNFAFKTQILCLQHMLCGSKRGITWETLKKH